VSARLIVIIRPAAADDEGTHVPDSGHGHKEGSVMKTSDEQWTGRPTGARQSVAQGSVGGMKVCADGSRARARHGAWFALLATGAQVHIVSFAAHAVHALRSFIRCRRQSR
jgi:hypothetical protein